MEEVKNHEKKERSCFRDCLSGHCRNCNWGHKIVKILIAVIVVGALICVGVVLGSRNSRFGDRGDFMMNDFYQGRAGGPSNFSGGCGRQDKSREFYQGSRIMKNQADDQKLGVGCNASTNCGNLNCPLNQGNNTNPPAVPNSPASFIPVSTSTLPLQ